MLLGLQFVLLDPFVEHEVFTVVHTQVGSETLGGLAFMFSRSIHYRRFLTAALLFLGRGLETGESTLKLGDLLGGDKMIF